MKRCVYNGVIPVLFMVMVLSAEAQSFEEEVIDDNIQIGYGLAIGDVNDDGKDDILPKNR
jgi:hypothetical protein